MESLLILLIEPNKSHASLIRSGLLEINAKVTIEHSLKPSTAYTKLKNKQYDIILTEIDFDKLDPKKYIEKIGVLAGEIPILVLTSLNIDKMIAKMIKAGAEDYVIKTKESLLALPKIINKILSRKSRTSKVKKIKEDPSQSKLNQVMGTLNALQKNLAKMTPKEMGPEIYDQMKGLKKIVFSILKGK